MKISIIGGGNLGQTCMALFLKKNINVNLITRFPKLFKTNLHELKVYDDYTKVDMKKCSINDDIATIKNSDIVLCTTPVSTYKDMFIKMNNHINKNTSVGCIYQAPFVDHNFKEIMPNNKFFCLQYVPFQAKIIEYGISSHIVGKKSVLNVATTHNELINTIQTLFDIPTIKCSFLSFILTSSNPILHIPRYYDLYKDIKLEFPNEEYKIVKFEGSLYKDMNLSSSIMINEMMLEILKIKSIIVKRYNIDLSNIKHISTRIKEQYGSQVSDYSNLMTIFNTAKMYNKSSFNFRKYKNNPLLYPDITHRHFTDDLQYGLIPIQQLAQFLGIKTPMIDFCINWGCDISNISNNINNINIEKYFNESIKEKNK